MRYPTLLFLFAFCFAACKKTNTPAQDQLPPITQTGAGTFGCLISGEVYTPQGFEQNRPAFDMIVDPTFQNGNFGFSIFNKKKKIRFNLGSNDIKNAATYYINDFSKTLTVSVFFDNTNCYFGPTMQCIVSGPCYVNGQLIISKYDLSNKIFSGTFEFTLFDPATSCDTIRITQGRFDKKLN